MPETKEKVLTVAEVRENVTHPQVVDSLKRFGTDLEVFVQVDEGDPLPLEKLSVQKYNPEGAHQRVVLKMHLGAAEKKVKEEPFPATHTHSHSHGRSSAAHDRE